MAKTEDTLTELLGQINQAAKKGLLGGAQQDLRQLNRYKDTFKGLISAINKAYEDGFEGQAQGLQEVQEKLNENIKSYSAQINKCMTHLRKNLTDSERAAAEARLKSLKTELAQRIKSQAELAQKEIAHNNKIIEDYKTKRVNLKKQVSEQFLEMKLGDSVEGAFNNLTSALNDGGQTIGKGITGAFKVGAGLLASRQATLAFRAKQTSDTGEKASLEKSAQAMAGMGKAMLIIGASVGALFAVVKAFQAIEEAGKKINKQLITEIGATDLMANKTGNLYEEVNKMRQLVTKADFALSLGMTTEEAISLVKEFNEANFSLASLGDNAEEATGRLHDMMMTVRSGAVALGVSTSELVGFAERYRMEMGMSARESGFTARVAEDFKSIRDMAMQSGYSTSKFFDKVKSLTEGLGKFNVRTEQAGKLLISLTKVIGPEAAEQFTKGLMGAFRQEGYTDRLKRLMTTPQRQVAKALTASAKSQANDFSRNFLRSGKSKDIFAQYGITGENIVEGTKSLSDADVKKLLGELQGAGQTGAARQFYEVMDALHSKGRMGQVRQLGQADAGATLRVKASQFTGVMGGKSIREAGLGKLKLLETLGFSPEEIEQYAKIVELKEAELGMLRQKKILTEEEQKQYGVQMREGQLYNVETGEKVDNVEAYLQAQGARLEKEFGDLKAPTLEEIMQDNIRATQTSSEKLGAHLGEIMQGVYDVTMGIYNKIFGDDQSDKAKAAQAQLLEETQAKIAGFSKEIISNNDKMRQLQGKAKSSKDPAEKKAINEQIDALKKRNQSLSDSQKLNKASLAILNREKLTSESIEEMRSETLNKGVIKLAQSSPEAKERLLSSGMIRSPKSLLDMEIKAKELGYSSAQEMLDFDDYDHDEFLKITSALEEIGVTLRGYDTTGNHVTYQDGMGMRYKGGRVAVDAEGRVIGAQTGTKKFSKDTGTGLFGSLTSPAEESLNVAPLNPMDPQVQKARKKDAEAQVEESAKSSAMKKAREEGVYKGMKRAQQEDYESRIKGMASELGLSTQGSLKQITERFAGAREGLKTDNPDLVGRLGEVIGIAKEAGFIDDGFVLKNGRATRIAEGDNVLAFKDGGPADPRRMNKATASININIMGGRPDTIPQFQRAVEQVLRKTGVVVEPGNRLS